MKKILKFLIFPVFVILTLSTPRMIQGMDPSYDIVERVFDSNIRYSSAIVDHYYEGNGTLLTLPRSPQKARTQSVLLYNTPPTRETILMRVIPGEDGRKQIRNTTSWPYSIHAHLHMILGREPYGGSGVIVGPHHLLTCGHNVYNFDTKSFFQEISVYPALNGNVAPFNKVKVVKAYIFRRWQDQGDQRFDIALLLLDQSIGNYTGWGGLLSAPDARIYQENVDITGYPADKGFNQMWTMCDRVRTVKAEEFEYEIDTAGAQSGSAIWINQQDMPMVLGVHTLGDYIMNSGVRLSEEKFKKLFKVIGDTYNLNKIDSLITNSWLDFIRQGFLSPQGSSRIIACPPVPLVARGHEEDYRRFLKGFLVYVPQVFRPQAESDDGEIILPIADLKNPLESTFDLSRCADMGQSLSISTGYRKEKKAENAGKTEIWITPRFLIEKELNTTAKHFQEIYSKWKENAPVGIFWTYSDDDLSSYYYLITQNMDELCAPGVVGKGTKNSLYLYTSKVELSASRSLIQHLLFLASPVTQAPVNFYIRFADDISQVKQTIPPSLDWLRLQDEAAYTMFFNGALIYRPKPGSNDGMLKLPIKGLFEPLESTFDLSQCGDASKYLSISTGYRRAKKEENAGKIEIWLTPRFLIEEQLHTSAKHFQYFQETYSKWKENAPIGIFWSWGGSDSLSDYDYLITQNMDKLSNNNLHHKWREKDGETSCITSHMWRASDYLSRFHVRFVDGVSQNKQKAGSTVPP